MRLCTPQVFAVPEGFSFSILNHVFLSDIETSLSLPTFKSSVLLGMIHYEKSRGRLKAPNQFSPFEKLIESHLERERSLYLRRKYVILNAFV